MTNHAAVQISTLYMGRQGWMIQEFEMGGRGGEGYTPSGKGGRGGYINFGRRWGGGGGHIPLPHPSQALGFEEQCTFKRSQPDK